MSPEEVKRGLERARAWSYCMHSIHITHANTVHMSRQGLSGTSVGPHTSFLSRFHNSATAGRKGVEESKTDRRLPSTPLPHKTATWPAQLHDLLITQTLLQNVKDISPHILVPQTLSEHLTSPLPPRPKVATCPFGSEKWNGSTYAPPPLPATPGIPVYLINSIFIS